MEECKELTHPTRDLLRVLIEAIEKIHLIGCNPPPSYRQEQTICFSSQKAFLDPILYANFIVGHGSYH